MGRTVRRLLFALAWLGIGSLCYGQNVMPIPHQQFFDNTGVPLASGKLCSYAAGTTTPQNTYSDSALSTPNANPVVLNSAGRPSSGGNEIGVFLSALSYKFVLLTAGSDGTCSTGTTIWTQDNVLPAASGVAFASLNTTVNQFSVGFNSICDARLTLTSGLPVTTADVTAATSVFVTPYKGNRCALFDGSATWNLRTFSEITVSVPASASQMFDLFCFDNSGSMACETLAWTNDTTRATALTLQNGVEVKTGATTRRYMGSFRTTTVAGQTEDSFAKRYVWNMQNRVKRAMRVTESTASWNYTTATWRQANGATANQLDCIIGLSEALIEVQVVGAAGNSTGVANFSVGIGEDSTTAPVTGSQWNLGTSDSAGNNYGLTAALRKYPAVGRHTYVWLEISTAAGTTTFLGNGTFTQSGIQGWTEG